MKKSLSPEKTTSEKKKKGTQKLESLHHKEKKNSFIDQSGGKTNSLNNEKGEILFTAILALIIVGLLITLVSQFYLATHFENEVRKNTYLCLKETFDNYHDLSRFIHKTNNAIIGLNASMVFIKTAPAAMKMKKAVQQAQNIYALNSFRKAVFNKSCKIYQKLFTKISYPLMGTGFIPKRSPFGTALFKKISTKVTLISNIRPFPHFIIKGVIRAGHKFIFESSQEINFLEKKRKITAFSEKAKDLAGEIL